MNGVNSMTTHTTWAQAQTADKDQRLSTIFEIAKILVRQQDLEAMLSGSLSCLVETLEAVESGVMLLYDPSDERLAVSAAHGYDLACLKQIRLAPGEATCGKTFQTGQAQLYSTSKAIAASIPSS